MSETGALQIRERQKERREGDKTPRQVPERARTSKEWDWIFGTLKN